MSEVNSTRRLCWSVDIGMKFDCDIFHIYVYLWLKFFEFLIWVATELSCLSDTMLLYKSIYCRFYVLLFCHILYPTSVLFFHIVKKYIDLLWIQEVQVSCLFITKLWPTQILADFINSPCFLFSHSVPHHSFILQNCQKVIQFASETTGSMVLCFFNKSSDINWVTVDVMSYFCVLVSYFVRHHSFNLQNWEKVVTVVLETRGLIILSFYDKKWWHKSSYCRFYVLLLCPCLLFCNHQSVTV